jgi:hypothetical protein
MTTVWHPEEDSWSVESIDWTVDEAEEQEECILFIGMPDAQAIRETLLRGLEDLALEAEAERLEREEATMLEDIALEMSCCVSGEDKQAWVREVVVSDVGMECYNISNFIRLVGRARMGYTDTELWNMWRVYLDRTGIVEEVEDDDCDSESDDGCDSDDDCDEDCDEEVVEKVDEVAGSDEEAVEDIDEDEWLEEVAEKVSMVIGNLDLRDLTYMFITTDVGLYCESLGEFKDIMVASLKDIKAKKDPKDRRRKLLKVKVNDYTKEQIEIMWEAYQQAIFG